MTFTAQDFRDRLSGVFERAIAEGKTAVEVNAGDLHSAMGDYPDPSTHRMPNLCRVMRSLMLPGDKIVDQPPKGDGASLTIRYRLPRP